ncbi:hypothetical protein HMPREF9969_0480 [Prevotella sp. oral taxon 306 str. F0472]|nr:hypothetical protein HMPREF9969_0480 [Prevotella sp. oral taxon 306 str. F0472]
MKRAFLQHEERLSFMQGNAFVQWKKRPLLSHNRMIRIKGIYL